jgi:outer membrane receptor protein involved in Fe transport
VTGILQQEALYSTFINRSPTAAEIAALCPTVTTGSCTTTPPTVIADLRLRNLTELNTDGLDVRVTDQFDIGASTLSLGLNANYVFSYKRRFTPNAPITDFVDTLNNPNHLRLRGNIGWTLGAFSLDAAANFTDAYRDPGLNRPIGSWTTIDAGLTFQPRSGVLNGFELGLRANNLFNERPPFVNSAGGYDPVNATPLGRFISVELRKRW